MFDFSVGLMFHEPLSVVQIINNFNLRKNLRKNCIGLKWPYFKYEVNRIVSAHATGNKVASQR